MKITDKMRLDWILAREQWYLSGASGKYFYNLLGPFDTKKEAIDAAIRAEKASGSARNEKGVNSNDA